MENKRRNGEDIKAIGAGIAVGVLLAGTVLVYAISQLFYSEEDSSDFAKKTVFQFDLDTGLNAISGSEIGPGDSFSVNPFIYNDATEAMYVFIVMQMPMVDGKLLYTFDIDEDWVLVEESDGSVVYAYGASEMTLLLPGESTTELTKQMTMREITNAEYSQIDDINITFTGYAIGTENVDSNPGEAWNYCKSVGNIR